MKKIKIIAHRGYSGKYNENTKTAFLKAIRYKADGIEFDVQKTKDNEFVVIHDDKIDKISKKKGRIKNFLLKDLKKVKIFNNDKILTLKEVLKLIPDNLLLDIELKAETINIKCLQPIVELILKYKKKDNVIVTSFKHELLYYFKQNNIKIGLLVGERVLNLGFFGVIKTILHLKHDYLCLPILMKKYFNNFIFNLILKSLRIIGNKFIFWTVNHENELQYIKNYAEYIITNDIEKMIAIIRN
jgi:glycerophosphoryl diester phosphodiesterase